MRGYTNKKGEYITVSKEHLDMAVEVKIQLQSNSPSRKCSWVTHKRVMEESGFYDSDTNEQYRLLIKNYQRSLDKDDEGKFVTDTVAKSNSLDAIKNIVGEMAYEKRSNQHVLRQINKSKNKLIDFATIVEEIRQAFDNHDFKSVEFNYQPLPSSNNDKMIVVLSDLHIGAMVSNMFNTYNFEIAKERLENYLNNVIAECKRREISEVYVMNVGDSIEHNYMHNLAINCEFPLTEQIVKASDLIIKFLKTLSEHVNITYSGIAGNHDRMNDNKNKNVDGDHASRLINNSVKLFIEHSNAERIEYVEANDYEHSFEVNGAKVKAIHGDLDSIDDKNLIAKYCAKDGIDYNLLIGGHYHHFKTQEQGYKKRIVFFGSLKGADAFGVKTNRVSIASQGYIIVDNDGKVTPIQVELQ